MTFRSHLRYLVFFVLLIALPLSQTSCTSSEDEDVSVLEEELESMGGDSDPFADDIEGLDDFAEEDLLDVVDEGDDSLAELDEEFSEGGDFDDEFADEGFDDEFADEDFSDEEFSDEEFSEGGDGQVAENEFDEFDEFNELEQGGEKDPFAQSEESLAKELNKQGEDYPITENAKPQFPEEVIGANPPPGSETVPPGQSMGGPLPPTNGPLITSETQELMDLPDPIEPTIPQDDLGMADPIVPLDDGEMPDEQNWVPVVKIKTDPFYRNERLMNAVYIARPDDSLGSISQKIYGEDRSKEMLADNGHLEKGIDPGDKVYYNSPNRSDDRTNLKFYYEDIGLPPQFYKTKDSDNMRRLGTKLLGFSEGWKEIWAINPQVDSKTILPSGMELKYWTGNESKPQLEIAGNTTPEEYPPSDPIEDDPMSAGTVDDPFQETELPPEPPLPEAQVGGPDPTLEPEPVPDIEPFPEDGIEEAPIPPPQQAAVQPVENNSSLLSIGAIALLIMAGAGLVAIQIKKRKDATGMTPASLEYTQV